MSKPFRILIIVLLGFMAIASGFQSLSIYSNRFVDSTKEYPSQGAFFSLNEMKEENNLNVEEKLYEYADKYEAVIIRRDNIFSLIDGSSEGYRIGVYGNVDKQSESLLLEFNGVAVLDSNILSVLLNSDPESTLGLDKNRADMIQDIPTIAYSSRLVAMQLPQLIKDSATLRGNYKFVGLSSEQFDAFLSEISTLSNVDRELLLQQLSGSGVAYSILDVYSLVALLACLVFIGLTAFLGVFLSVRRYGTHAMLGWSRWAYIGKLNSPFIITALLLSCVPAGIIMWGFQGYPFTPQLIGTMLVTMMKFLFLAVVALLPAALGLAFIKPVKAIRNQVSQISLLMLSILLFIASSAGITGALRAIDGPLDELHNATEVQTQWNKHSDYKILRKVQAGNNDASFAGGQSDEHYREFYSWYQAIEGKPGVHLVNTTFYNDEILQTWQESYTSSPKKPLWYMLASPSYLETIDFPVSDEDKNLALSGTRVYYIPDTYMQKERESLSAWLEEDSLKDRGESIVTPFMKNPKIEFRYYTPSNKLFMWNTNPNNDFFAPDPVIYLATSANMTPFESESLNAIGLEESYIKLSSEAAKQYTNESFLAHYGLDDNKPQFLPVSEFIAGLHKSLSEFIQLFGGIALFVIFLDLALLLILVSLYAQIYSQQIAVKRLLGYPLRSIFTAPFILVTTVSSLCVTAAVLLGSRIGLAIIIALMVIQLLLLAWQAKRLATRQINIVVKDQ